MIKKSKEDQQSRRGFVKKTKVSLVPLMVLPNNILFANRLLKCHPPRKGWEGFYKLT
jgi:hypothetical protein